MPSTALQYEGPAPRIRGAIPVKSWGYTGDTQQREGGDQNEAPPLKYVVERGIGYCLTDRLSFFSTLATLLWRRPACPFR